MRPRTCSATGKTEDLSRQESLDILIYPGISRRNHINETAELKACTLKKTKQPFKVSPEVIRSDRRVFCICRWVAAGRKEGIREGRK